MNIILAVDGSEHAQAALDLLKSLPLPIRSTITTIAVADAPDSHHHYTQVQVLEKACEQLMSSSLEIKSTLLHGHPAHEIVQICGCKQARFDHDGCERFKGHFWYSARWSGPTSG